LLGILPSHRAGRRALFSSSIGYRLLINSLRYYAEWQQCRQEKGKADTMNPLQGTMLQHGMTREECNELVRDLEEAEE
jgi:hypothetical protein